MKAAKTLDAARANPAGLTFAELQRLIEAAGFSLVRVNGSHRIYTRKGIAEIVNLQPKGKGAKAYQVREVLEIIERYGIEIE